MLHTWVSSAGGPLIAVPQSELGSWAGVDLNDGPLETWGDYGRACAVEGYVGLVAVGAQQALVLGDEPAMTTYLSTERLFLRWGGADSESDLVEAARRIFPSGPAWDDDEDLSWEVGGPVVLFDSALPGAELQSDERLDIDIEPGRYRVRATYSKDEDNSMILVQLQLVARS